MRSDLAGRCVRVAGGGVSRLMPRLVRRGLAIAGMAVGLCAAQSIAAGQGFDGGGRGRRVSNASYDGRFALARLRYTEYRSSGWAYDYRTMERNLMLMVRTITSMLPHTRECNILQHGRPGADAISRGISLGAGLLASERQLVFDHLPPMEWDCYRASATNSTYLLYVRRQQN